MVVIDGSSAGRAGTRARPGLGRWRAVGPAGGRVRLTSGWSRSGPIRMVRTM